MPGRKVTFDENGAPVEETETIEGMESTESDPEGVADGNDPDTTDETESEESETPETKVGKYRIGDQSFDTLEDAHAFATSHIDALTTQTAIDDAYRRGIIDARGNIVPPESVTPPEDDFNEEEYFADPKSFLKKFATKIKTETQAEIDQRASARAQDDQIWNEFTSRHPDLAEYRAEVEDYTAKNAKEVGAIANLKGRSTAYDHVAVKMKAQFKRYAEALKPKRTLPNGGGGPTPTARGTSVTPKPTAKKPLSFADQVRSIKRVR